MLRAAAECPWGSTASAPSTHTSAPQHVQQQLVPVPHMPCQLLHCTASCSPARLSAPVLFSLHTLPLKHIKLSYVLRAVSAACSAASCHAHAPTHICLLGDCSVLPARSDTKLRTCVLRAVRADCTAASCSSARRNSAACSSHICTAAHNLVAAITSASRIAV